MKCIHQTAGVCDWTLQPCRSPACNEEVSEMKRINIKIRDGIPELQAISAILEVIKMGRVSGDNDTYCYVTTFKHGIVVFAGKTRAGHDTFDVRRDVRREENGTV